jgi:hypothetical protein
MSDDDEDSSTDDDFLAYLLDDDDDDDYDDDVALFSLVGAYITELSRKSGVQRRPSFYVRDRLEWDKGLRGVCSLYKNEYICVRHIHGLLGG